jgi:hypothetical protein
MGLIHIPQDRVQQRDLENSVMNNEVIEKEGSFTSSKVTIF